MQTKAILLAFAVLFSGSLSAQTTEKLVVNFASDSYLLDNSEKEKLQSFLDKKIKDNLVSLQLKGHTDDVGSDSYNKVLSKNRVITVSEFLVENGISPAKINADFFGETLPAETNKNEKGKANNRRVEVLFTLKPEIEKKNTAINPPLPGLEKQFQVYTINPMIPCTVTTKSGAQIRIPANAFADENGKTVRGEIQVAFRDYYKPLEILLSGIPMNYDSAGTSYHFETDGMFEIQAKQNGKELSVANNKNIEVDVPATPGSSGFSLYNLQDNGNWENIAQPAELTEYTKALSPAWSLYVNSMRSYNFPDTTPFAQRFPDQEYEYLTKKGNGHSADANITWMYEFRLKSVFRKSGDEKGLVKFKITGYTQGMHKEMRPLMNQTWVYDGIYNKRDFAAAVLTNKFSSKRYFNDMRLMPNKSGDGYMMVMKGDEGFMRIPVHPYGVWDRKEKNSKEKLKVRESMQKAKENKAHHVYNTYAKRLLREEKSFDKELNKQKEKALVEWDKIDGANNEMIRNAMSDEEKKMSDQEWQAYVEKVQKSQLLAQKSANIVFRTVNVNGMGVYNCDRIGKLRNPVPIIADCRDKEEQPLAPIRTFVLDKKLNGVMTFYNNNITLDPKTLSAIIVLDYEGKLAFANAETLKNINFKPEKEVAIVLEKLNEQPKTEEEFGKLIGLASK